MPIESWLLYVAAVLVLTVTPGPSVLMCVSNAVQVGARRTVFTALGSVTAVVGIMVCAGLGLGAVLATSETVFNAIKWLGVAYLLYLGIGGLRSTAGEFKLPDGARPVTQSRWQLYAQGILVGISNPKALLFFSAFFPQFINPASPQLPQFLVLGATFVVLELFWLMFYATFAARAAPWLREPGRARIFNRVTGSLFVGAALLLATVKR